MFYESKFSCIKIMSIDVCCIIELWGGKFNEVCSVLVGQRVEIMVRAKRGDGENIELPFKLEGRGVLKVRP